MSKEAGDEIVKLIQSFNANIEKQLPFLETEIDKIIQTTCKEINLIERYLDTLLSLTMFGMADALFIRLLEYYKTIDEDGAAFYWNEYDKDEE